jgi:hypothetical protein
LSKSIIYVLIRSISIQTYICCKIHSLFQPNSFSLFHNCQFTTAFSQLITRIRFLRICSWNKHIINTYLCVFIHSCLVKNFLIVILMTNPSFRSCECHNFHARALSNSNVSDYWPDSCKFPWQQTRHQTKHRIALLST